MSFSGVISRAFFLPFSASFSGWPCVIFSRVTSSTFRKGTHRGNCILNRQGRCEPLCGWWKRLLHEESSIYPPLKGAHFGPGGYRGQDVNSTVYTSIHLHWHWKCNLEHNKRYSIFPLKRSAWVTLIPLSIGRGYRPQNQEPCFSKVVRRFNSLSKV